MAGSKTYIIGDFLNPVLEDKDTVYRNLDVAIRHARGLSASLQKRNSVVGIWDERDDPVVIFINGEAFQPE